MAEQKVNLMAEVTLVTSFQDADPMGVIYHGNYFRFFEESRRLLMEKINYNYRDMVISGYAWPVIDSYVKYVQAIPFNHEIRITAKLAEWENYLRVDYVIYDAQSGKRMTKGYTRQVAVDMKTEEMCFASPKILAEKLEPYFV
ncbi:acyl-CoA thioesterase [Psychromonas sp. RZ22]|uniref:acyl-CoA thioesterase n=1 Tax=Psychromonas algarum TaxID=2555643 RepID=UPI0010681E7E|nr:acyl-CoA thioesterase [Psychromonas sp. RZ22]TEW54088.1 acyl-CoA thioesterase [Psychromonas sp. RZ22]